MIVSVFNQKGGTGKTTTVVNLGTAIAEQGYDVLVVDFDLQANLSYSLGVKAAAALEHLLENGNELKSEIVKHGKLNVLPNLPIGFDKENHLSTPFLLSNSIQEIKDSYDYIFIDCPPTISDHALNALCASDFVLIPFQQDVLSVQGLIQVLSSVEQINSKYNHSLEVFGALPVMVDRRRMLTDEILDHIRENYQLDIMDSYVRHNVNVAKSPSLGMSVLEYQTKSIGSNDYRQLAKEFIEKSKELMCIT